MADLDSMIEQTSQETDEQPFFDFGDVVAAPFRGLEGAAQDLYSLFDTLAGDNLPDWDERYLGESRSTVGGIVEGISQFASGFIPVAGQLGKVGAFAKSPLLRGAVAGAITDFAFFDGQQGRLSDLVQRYPVLQNPITEFLSSDEDDSELEGRFKNALEGVGIGAFVDTAFLALKRHKAIKTAIDNGASPEEAAQAGRQAVKDEIMMESVSKNTTSSQVPNETVDETIFSKSGAKYRFEGRLVEDSPLLDDRLSALFLDLSTKDVVVLDNPSNAVRSFESIDDVLDSNLNFKWDPKGKAFYDSYGAADGPILVEFSPSGSRAGALHRPESSRFNVSQGGQLPSRIGIDIDNWSPSGVIDEYVKWQKAVPEADVYFFRRNSDDVPAHIDGLRNLKDLESKAGKDVSDVLEDAASHANDDFSVAPRNMTEAAREARNLHKRSLHLAAIGTEEEAKAYTRAAAKRLDSSAEAAISDEALVDLAAHYKDAFDGDENVFLTRIKGAGDRQRQLALEGLVMKEALETQGNQIKGLVQEILGGNDLSTASLKDKMEIFKAIQKHAAFSKAYRDLGTETGRALRSRQIRVTRSLGEFSENSNVFRTLEPLTDDQALKRFADENGGLAAVEAEMKKYITALDEGVGAKIGAVGGGGRAVRVLNEYWMNAILSGPKTHAVNVISNTVTTFYRPLEAMLGNTLRSAGDLAFKGKLQKDTLKIWQDLGREMTGLFQAIPESFRMAKIALRENQGVLLPGSSKAELKAARDQSIQASTFKLQDEDFLGRLVNFLGDTINLPGRALTGMDEFFKQMNYRARANADLYRFVEGQIARGTVQPEDFAEALVTARERFFRDGQAFSVKNIYDEGVENAKRLGAVTDDEINAGALDYIRQNEAEIQDLRQVSRNATEAAEEATHTAPLGVQGGLVDDAAAKIQALTISHPSLRFILPFVRTPTNLLKFSARRLDIQHFVMGRKYAKEYKRLVKEGMPLTEAVGNRFRADILSGDPRRKTEALGRLAAGTSAMLYFSNLAMSGDVTGRGPENPAQRKALEATGWQPYSIKTDDGYVSYQRFDPFAGIIGSVVDLVQYSKYAEAEKQSTVEAGMSAVLFSFANNFTNKSYLTGMENFIALLSKPERRAERFVNRFGGSFVPSIVSQSVTTVDGDTTREVQGLVDTLMSRTPGWSKDLPPVRNILGKPVEKITSLGYDSVGQIMDMFLPIAYTEVNDNLVVKEMANLRWAFTPPRSTRGGVDMRDFKAASGQDAYDRMMELQGTLKLNGRTLQDQLRKTIQSDFYKRQSDQSDLEFEPPRVKTIKRIINRYNRAAFRKTLTEFPEYREAYIQVRRRKREAFRGRLEPLNLLNQ